MSEVPLYPRVASRFARSRERSCPKPVGSLRQSQGCIARPLLSHRPSKVHHNPCFGSLELYYCPSDSDGPQYTSSPPQRCFGRPLRVGAPPRQTPDTRVIQGAGSTPCMSTPPPSPPPTPASSPPSRKRPPGRPAAWHHIAMQGISPRVPPGARWKGGVCILPRSADRGRAFARRSVGTGRQAVIHSPSTPKKRSFRLLNARLICATSKQNSGPTLEATQWQINLPQMPPDSGGICKGVD